MEIGVVGQPNVGKSTLFNALTLLNVPMAPYPFTTTRANRGVSAVRVPCPHSEKQTACTPGNSPCVDGTRWVPVNLLDLPGLVPGAHEGRGLGHQFLDELRAANGFIQVVDLTGGTTPEGVPAAPGTHDPAAEAGWLEEELVEWVAGILARDFDKGARSLELEGGKLEDFLEKRLTGLSISAPAIAAALRTVSVDRAHPSLWGGELRRTLARELLRAAKPRLIAANKCDRASSSQFQQLAESVAPIPATATSAEAELTLRRAARAGLVKYRPGDASFSRGEGVQLTEGQSRALHDIEEVLATWGSTGVQQALESIVFGKLRRVAVFPVEDEVHWTDSKGRVLPDVFLVPAETSVREVAFRVHTDLGENFIRAIDGRTHRALAADHPVSPGSVLRIVARR
ncbi:MAG: YchF-related putative GTPase [Thermoplasmata archaeon]|nr:YchF-related putative GTPase [Thermoplasmata archaeon]